MHPSHESPTEASHIRALRRRHRALSQTLDTLYAERARLPRSQRRGLERRIEAVTIALWRVENELLDLGAALSGDLS